MRSIILAPHGCKEFLCGHSNLDLSYIYYRSGYETSLQKVMRKIGLKDVHHMLDVRIRITEGTDLLEEVYALWLSPALVLNSKQMECLLDRLPGLKWVYSQMAGFDHLDLELFKKRGIMVSNNGSLNSRRVAEMALACIFAHAKRLYKHFEIQRRRDWKSQTCDDLRGQTVGIIGTGNIGREVAILCRAIGMQVVGASRNPRRFGRDPSPYHDLVPFDGGLVSLLAESDHVVLAVPLNQQTRGMIGIKELNGMKPNSSLVNVSRAAVADENALREALTAGKIGAAYVDPPSDLSPSIFSRRYRTPNLVFTHNSASNNLNVLEEACEQFLEGMRNLMDIGQPPNRVA